MKKMDLLYRLRYSYQINLNIKQQVILLFMEKMMDKLFRKYYCILDLSWRILIGELDYKRLMRRRS
jgi:hypothetical protein